ncbi:hypothetical protein PIIN_07088 [Serendipita indica DSM 11827]|uniref:Uncharacterized protein n=1 Tax=Serendipita indica (strain DSM 11827) TaxID=1109443 RepID=G4TP91_SERID|nr:hypothetical protein PIIN_07088 [Serendipita indica DSM 11827]
MGRTSYEGFDEDEYEEYATQANTAELMEQHRLLTQQIKALNTQTRPTPKGGRRQKSRQQRSAEVMIQVVEDVLHARGVEIPQYDS